MHAKVFIILCLLAASQCMPDGKNNGDLDSILDDIFGIMPSDVKPSDVKPSGIKPSDVKPSGVKPSDVKPSDKPSSINDPIPALNGEKCTINGKQGKCVVYYRCKIAGESIKEDITGDVALTLTYCESPIDICCLERNILSENELH